LTFFIFLEADVCSFFYVLSRFTLQSFLKDLPSLAPANPLKKDFCFNRGYNFYLFFI